MAGSGFRTQTWGPMSPNAGLGFQGPELGAPLPAHPHRSPPTLQQQWYEAPYGHIGNFPMHHAAEPANGNFGNPNNGRSPYLPGGGYQMSYQHQASSNFGFMHPHPRPPPAFRSGTSEVRTNFAGPTDLSDTFSRADQAMSHNSQPLLPFHHQPYGPSNNSMPGLRPYPQRYSSMASPATPSRFEDREVLPQPQGGGRTQGTTQEHQPASQAPHRRMSNRDRQSYNSRGYDTLGRRAMFGFGFDAQSSRHDTSNSPRGSNRRSFDRYQFDLPQSSTSSDAEEAAARAPPSSRARFRPREVRPRFHGHQYTDPNLVSLRQIQDLKDSLPRHLPSELPEETSKCCDICSKDYSKEHVKPAEEAEVAIELPCGHVFGEFCIFEWFDTCKTHKNKVTCPMCRKQLIEPSRYPPAVLNMMARDPQTFHDLLTVSELRMHYSSISSERPEEGNAF